MENCSECGSRIIPDDARFCSRCGRRVVPERQEPVLDPHGVAEAPALLRPPTSPVREPLRLPDVGAYLARASQAIAAWRPAPHAAVALGCLLAISIYWSAAHDEIAENRAGAARISAAIGARPTTSQIVKPGSTRFSAREALQGLYGNYDPVLDGAFWTVTGAPKGWSEWNGRSVLIRPLVSRSNDAATRHVLLTSSVEVKDGMIVKQGASCRLCKSLIGGVLFERQGDEWKLVSDQRFLGVEGAFGAPPRIAVAFPPAGGVELRIEPTGDVDTAMAASPVVMSVTSGGEKVKGLLTQPRPRPKEPAPVTDTPFPTAVAGP